MTASLTLAGGSGFGTLSELAAALGLFEIDAREAADGRFICGWPKLETSVSG
jgi:hypothetical protein